ncbi:hypothetical protein SAMN05421776_108205 [Nocardia farcinica]|uniref:DUF7172 domain-containing protein n=1 Tax=Nocardia farcinica TaxID=37329 RepID=A0A0H5ND99_NOCFR|nr:hypothetical protein [Nocardia farcinica]AXK88814.1 hypothetical protein DXT66_27160 [Nocardia farcinica]MBA4858086.1 hypothetical protein [Nocardia farcinica]MBC9819383.1 hypothetical protein [Nocardia farcinica]MBF6410951.1 hypothetical protein [Nocardia farcinica]PFX04071.1 hypothetical protein CJ469_01945 [Nocardia farcinica]
MTLAICSSEWMFSSPRGTGLGDGWLPRIAAERFVASTRDGEVQRASDPVPFIQAELSWTNTTGVDQECWLGTHRAPRTIVAANPNTYVLDDAITWDVGLSPNAPEPYLTEDGIGAKGQGTPWSYNQVHYARMFRGWDDSVRFDGIGTVPAGDTVHIRYAALYTTPGQWRAPSNALQVVRAFWVRLRLWAIPEDTP